MKRVDIFTDGSCLGNPGAGGYGAILRYGPHQKELSAGYKLTTNNRMEMLAVIKAMQTLTEPCLVTLTTDSQYVKNGIQSWLKNWKRNGWKTSAKEPVKNVDLWQQIDEQVQKHKVEWQWVKGHAGHDENEKCDELARKAAGKPTLEDKGYKP